MLKAETLSSPKQNLVERVPQPRLLFVRTGGDISTAKGHGKQKASWFDYVCPRAPAAPSKHRSRVTLPSLVHHTPLQTKGIRNNNVFAAPSTVCYRSVFVELWTSCSLCCFCAAMPLLTMRACFDCCVGLCEQGDSCDSARVSIIVRSVTCCRSATN